MYYIACFKGFVIRKNEHTGVFTSDFEFATGFVTFQEADEFVKTTLRLKRYAILKTT